MESIKTNPTNISQVKALVFFIYFAGTNLIAFAIAYRLQRNHQRFRLFLLLLQFFNPKPLFLRRPLLRFFTCTRAIRLA